MNIEAQRFEDILQRAEARTMTPNKIIRYFPDIHLGNGHDGLAHIALKNKVDVRKLYPGEFVIFVNKTQTGLKLFSQGNMVCYLKMPGSQRINPRVISLIPRFFNGSQINYSGALAEVINREFKK